ncbi:MAG: hypothetical protein NVV82_22400 [Sporocytophaga sp.]|nr:hypothetical protein [Sporocytophaga sp.]
MSIHLSFVIQSLAKDLSYQKDWKVILKRGKLLVIGFIKAQMLLKFSMTKIGCGHTLSFVIQSPAKDLSYKKDWKVILKRSMIVVSLVNQNEKL